MPIYEYKCQQCGLHVEKRQSISDDPLTTCEKCHGRLEKQWSLSGFQLKGEGWYVTDYAAKKGKAEKSSLGESTPKADTASNPVSETKAAKPETTVSKPVKE